MSKLACPICKNIMNVTTCETKKDKLIMYQWYCKVCDKEYELVSTEFLTKIIGPKPRESKL